MEITVYRAHLKNLAPFSLLARKMIYNTENLPFCCRLDRHPLIASERFAQPQVRCLITRRNPIGLNHPRSSRKSPP
jgi:hypothetical protein